MKATFWHCGSEWVASGELHNGFFLPDNPSDVECPVCGKESRSYEAVHIPLNQPRAHNED